jgi:hypothetical protein
MGIDLNSRGVLDASQNIFEIPVPNNLVDWIILFIAAYFFVRIVSPILRWLVSQFINLWKTFGRPFVIRHTL